MSNIVNRQCLEQHGFRWVAVVKGGWSAEQHFSSFFAAVPALRHLGFEVVIYDLKDDCLWEKLRHLKHHKGDRVVVLPLTLGPYGEDGCLQGMLELVGLPYVGSGVAASAIGMCKPLFKDLVRGWGIQVADGVLWHQEDPFPEFVRLVEQLGTPLVIKPPLGGASVDLVIAFDEETFRQGFTQAAARYDDLLIEQYVATLPGSATEAGRSEYVVSILQNDQQTWVLPVGEVQLSSSAHDLASKSHARYCYQTQLPDTIQRRMQENALLIYERLGCNGPVRVDLTLGADGLIYVYEINTLPGMTRDSAYALACAAAGLSYEQMWFLTLESAFHRRRFHVPHLAASEAPRLPASLRERLSPEEGLLYDTLNDFYPRPIAPVPHRIHLLPCVAEAEGARPSFALAR
jgi:D-alanine-D-alanine ligase